MYLLAEVSANSLTLCQISKKLFGSYTVREKIVFPFPSGVFASEAERAEPARKWLNKKLRLKPFAQVVVLANLRCAAIRTAELNKTHRKIIATGSYYGFSEKRRGVLREYIESSMPVGGEFGEDSRVFGFGVENDVLYIAALPFSVSEAIADMCEGLGIRIGAVRRIGILEYELSRYYGRLGPGRVYVCVPQENSIRIISISGGRLYNACSISRDPIYRDAELNRILGQKPNGPDTERERAVFILSDDLYGWLKCRFTEYGAEIIDDGDAGKYRVAAVGGRERKA